MHGRLGPVYFMANSRVMLICCWKIFTRNFCTHEFALQIPREMRCEFVCAKVLGDNLAEYGVIFCMVEMLPDISITNFGAHVFASQIPGEMLCGNERAKVREANFR